MSRTALPLQLTAKLPSRQILAQLSRPSISVSRGDVPMCTVVEKLPHRTFPPTFTPSLYYIIALQRENAISFHNTMVTE